MSSVCLFLFVCLSVLSQQRPHAREVLLSHRSVQPADAGGCVADGPRPLPPAQRVERAQDERRDDSDRETILIFSDVAEGQRCSDQHHAT